MKKKVFRKKYKKVVAPVEVKEEVKETKPKKKKADK